PHQERVLRGIPNHGDRDGVVGDRRDPPHPHEVSKCPSFIRDTKDRLRCRRRLLHRIPRLSMLLPSMPRRDTLRGEIIISLASDGSCIASVAMVRLRTSSNTCAKAVTFGPGVRAPHRRSGSPSSPCRRPRPMGEAVFARGHAPPPLQSPPRRSRRGRYKEGTHWAGAPTKRTKK